MASEIDKPLPDAEQHEDVARPVEMGVTSNSTTEAAGQMRNFGALEVDVRRQSSQTT